MTKYVTFTTCGQLFGLPIEHIQDVFMAANITRVPLAGPEIAGVLNSRGRILTIIDLANRLQLQSSADAVRQMAIGVELGPESFAILVDRVTEVVSLPDVNGEPVPINLDAKLCSVSAGIFRLNGEILVLLDAERILDTSNRAAAA
jgi:purine-binding chemotaxis protein CheW